jgi:hypothetical protein
MHMRSRVRIAVAALTVALALTATCGIANAGSFELSEEGYLIRWRAERPLTLIGDEFRVVCGLRFKGRFHSRTLAKVPGSLVGRVDRAEKGSCSSLEVRTLNGIETFPDEETALPNTLPWHIKYVSFSGALPGIQRIRLSVIGVSLVFKDIFGFECLYRSTDTNPFYLEINIEAAGLVTSATADESQSIPLLSGEGICPDEGRASGVADEITRFGKAAPGIIVRLI